MTDAMEPETVRPADATARPPDERRAWYVVYAKPRKEGTAEYHLRLRGVDVFHPRLKLPEYVDERRRVVPLFPGYLFVRIALARQFQAVAWTPGVNRFVGHRAGPTAIDDAVVAFLQQHADDRGLLQARPTLAVGQSVEITAGPFAGLVGIINHPPSAKGRVRVLMRLLNRGAVNVDVPLRFVRTGWSPTPPPAAVRART
jgi:transcription antitermination factor NusG